MIPVHVSIAADAVSRERVAAPRTVTRSAAVVSKAPVSHHAPVTMWPCHPRLARAVTIAGVAEGHRAERKDRRANWVAGTCFTSIGGREGPPEVSVETRLTALTMLTLGVVLTVVADTTAAIPGCLPHVDVEVTGVRVPIALAGSAFVRSPCSAIRCLPGPVVV